MIIIVNAKLVKNMVNLYILMMKGELISVNKPEINWGILFIKTK